MSATADADYIRGAGGVPVNRRTIVRVLVGGCILVLAALVVVLTIEAIGANSHADRLRKYGVPVNVTVTSCLGIASGTGITTVGYLCKGTLKLYGRTYTDTIEGTNLAYPVGQALQAVADAHDPTLLSTPAAAERKHTPWRAFISPAATLGLLLLVVVASVQRARRVRRHAPERPSRRDA